MTKNRLSITREHLIWSMAELPRPLDPAALFERFAPLVLEIGSGTGQFLTRSAAADPARNYLGVEISLKYARISAHKLQRDRIENACVISGDSRDVVSNLLPNSSVDACHILFPDPWFKKRHHKRRIFEPEFLRDLAGVIRTGGELFVKTDVREYFEQMVESFAEVPKFSPENIGEISDSHNAKQDGAIVTNFERKAVAKDHPVFRLHFTLK